MELSRQIKQLRAHSHLGEARLEWLIGAKLPMPYQDLLVHDHDMTSTLARFHGEKISLTILQASEREGVYTREVFLNSGKKVVEYGLIEVILENFDARLRARILEGRDPLGGILNECGVSYGSQPAGYFRIGTGDFSPEFFPPAGGNLLYGRYNVIVDSGGKALARIVEILPEEPS